MPDYTRPKPVDRFTGKHGRQLWAALTAPDPSDPSIPLFVFRPDELAVLEDACHQRDRAAALLTEVEAQGTTMVSGSAGQLVLDGRVTESRLLQVAARQALAQLRLPDLEPGAGAGAGAADGPVAWGAGDKSATRVSADADAARARSAKASKAAAARWHKAPGASAAG